MKVKLLVPLVISIMSITFSTAAACHVTLQCCSTEIMDGEYEGWYKYVYDVSWYMHFGQELDYWELKLPCDITDEAVFTEFDGSSNSVQHPFDPEALSWDGLYLDSDPVLGIDCPVLRFTPDLSSGEDVRRTGGGTFEVISNLIPEHTSLDDVVVLKYVGSTSTLTGDLNGCCYPTNTIVPEPATVCMLGLGCGLILMRKR